jgi:hypothetical protein
MLVVMGGCARTLGASTRVPNPVVAGAAGAAQETAWDLTIWIRDFKQPDGVGHPGGHLGPERFAGERSLTPLQVGPYRMPQAAHLRVATTDELRFDLLLTDPWRELTRLEEYAVELSVDRGAELSPQDWWVGSETRRDREVTYEVMRNYQTVHLGTETYQMWAPDQYTVRDEIWRGRSTVLFRRPGILGPETRSVTLTLRSRARTLRFTWVFDRPATVAAALR